MSEKKVSPIYKAVKVLLGVFYGKVKTVGRENLPEEGAIVAGNHSQLNGPISAELYFPGDCFTWCQGEMLEKENVRKYVYEDFWSQKPKRSRWYYKAMSYVVAPMLHFLTKNANTIGVYHDARLLSTFKNTVNALQEGNHIVIFPEHNVPHNHIIYDFQAHFIDVAKLYYKRTGKRLAFVPLYLAPLKRTMYFGKATYFDPDAPMDLERERIRRYLMEEITRMAVSLPTHIVIPYRNIPKLQYPKNTFRGEA